MVKSRITLCPCLYHIFLLPTKIVSENMIKWSKIVFLAMDQQNLISELGFTSTISNFM